MRLALVTLVLLGCAACPPLAPTTNVPPPWPPQDPAVKVQGATPAPDATPAPAPAQ